MVFFIARHRTAVLGLLPADDTAALRRFGHTVDVIARGFHLQPDNNERLR